MYATEEIEKLPNTVFCKFRAKQRFFVVQLQPGIFQFLKKKLRKSCPSQFCADTVLQLLLVSPFSGHLDWVWLHHLVCGYPDVFRATTMPESP